MELDLSLVSRRILSVIGTDVGNVSAIATWQGELRALVHDPASWMISIHFSCD